MTSRSAFMDEKVQRYIIDTMVVDEHPAQRALREETARMPDAGMQIGPDQAQFMQFLARMMPVHRYLEIGVFTGYSALSMALAMPEGGKIVGCDVSEEYTAIARRYWKDAGVEDKIDLRLAPATQTLEQLLKNDGPGPFDLAFIDADKANVDAYYEYALRLLRPHGLILIDNVLWDGRVVDEGVKDADTAALRAISAKAANDARVDACLLPLGDGVLIARKR